MAFRFSGRASGRSKWCWDFSRRHRDGRNGVGISPKGIGTVKMVSGFFPKAPGRSKWCWDFSRRHRDGRNGVGISPEGSGTVKIVLGFFPKASGRSKWCWDFSRKHLFGLISILPTKQFFHCSSHLFCIREHCFFEVFVERNGGRVNGANNFYRRI